MPEGLELILFLLVAAGINQTTGGTRESSRESVEEARQLGAEDGNRQNFRRNTYRKSGGSNVDDSRDHSHITRLRAHFVCGFGDDGVLN